MTNPDTKNQNTESKSVCSEISLPEQIRYLRRDVHRLNWLVSRLLNHRHAKKHGKPTIDMDSSAFADNDWRLDA